MLTAEGEKGVGDEPNHTAARKPGPLQIIQYYLAATMSTGWNSLKETKMLIATGQRIGFLVYSSSHEILVKNMTILY